jgi:hypothetical protein
MKVIVKITGIHEEDGHIETVKSDLELFADAEWVLINTKKSSEEGFVSCNLKPVEKHKFAIDTFCFYAVNLEVVRTEK